MKNNIFFKIKFILLIFLLIFNFNVNADEFFFEGNEWVLSGAISNGHIPQRKRTHHKKCGMPI